MLRGVLRRGDDAGERRHGGPAVCAARSLAAARLRTRRQPLIMGCGGLIMWIVCVDPRSCPVRGTWRVERHTLPTHTRRDPDLAAGGLGRVLSVIVEEKRSRPSPVLLPRVEYRLGVSSVRP
eukprot:4589020-Prymnesium_polylepis.3